MPTLARPDCSPEFSARFQELHRELMPGYRGHCVLVAQKAGSLLLDCGLPSSRLRITPSEGTQLVPKLAPNLSWHQHIVCARYTPGVGIKVYDPLLPEPVELSNYLSDTFETPANFELLEMPG